MPQPEFIRPFPALTPAQRYHLDVFGYVIVPNALTPDEVTAMTEALQNLKQELLATPNPSEATVRGAFFAINAPHHHYIGTISRAHSAITDYATHPKIVGMAEELIGGKAHIVEVNAHINTKAPEWDMGEDGLPRFGFHRGMPPGEGNHIKNGLFHSSFVKVLTNLTDIGPDDGGTVVIAGSHKVDAEDDAAIIAAAYEDRSLIHQVVAPAGSSLLFTESLLHATGQITSDRERIIIICGYNTSYFPWLLMDSPNPEHTLDPEFVARIPAALKHLFVSQGYIQREPRYRKLSDPVDDRPVEKIEWQ